MVKCKVCSGLGYIDCGDCTVLECTQCHSTGLIKNISSDTFNQIQDELEKDAKK